MQQILIISLNDNLSSFLKKQTVAGGLRESQNYTAGLLYKSERRETTLRTLPDLVDAEDDWEVSLFSL